MKQLIAPYEMNTQIIVLFITVIVPTILTEQCITPNNETAECVALYSCPVFLKGLGTLQEEVLEFVRQSNCGGTSVNPMVCCGSSSNFIRKNDKKESTVTISDLLPSSKVCGLQHSDDYFHLENSTIITEFPWLAHIQRHKQDGTRQYICSGSLINNRYVLTAAHCLRWHNGETITISVRLGEYNVKNETDCTEDSQVVECSEPVKDFDVEEVIIHPDFSVPGESDDIALIRLNKSVQYSDYIRPICLPFPERKTPKVGDILTSSGWGVTDQTSYKTAEIKKKVLSTIITDQECSQTLNKNGRILSNNQFCVKMSENGSDINCAGDSGAPVIFSNRAQWHQEGLVSFIAGRGCGYDTPLVLVKVRNYLNWIQDNIKH